jgi:hypothetical protein
VSDFLTGKRVGVEEIVGVGVNVFVGDKVGVLMRVAVGITDGEAAQPTRKEIEIASKSV